MSPARKCAPGSIFRTSLPEPENGLVRCELLDVLHEAQAEDPTLRQIAPARYFFRTTSTFWSEKSIHA